MELLVFLLIFDIIEMVIKMKDTIIYLIRHSEQYRDYVYNNAEKGSEINNFVKHATMFEQLKEFKLDYDGMLEMIESVIKI